MPTQPQSPLPTILIVHEDSTLVRWIRESFIDHRLALQINQARSVGGALFQLEHKTFRRPCLILASLNSWDKNLPLLRALKQSRRFRDLPLAMIGVSPHPDLIEEALSLGANACLDLPRNQESFKPLLDLVTMAIALQAQAELGTSETA